jgi:hypothetical protein
MSNKSINDQVAEQYKIVPEQIRKYFNSKGYDILFFGLEDSATISNIVKSTYKSNIMKKAIFVHSDYNDLIDIPSEVMVFRSAMNKSTKSTNEYVYPSPFFAVNEPFEPLPPIYKPRVSFCGSPSTYPLRQEWLDKIKVSNKLICDFITRDRFFLMYKHDLNVLNQYKTDFINNMKYSEFCFCPRGTGNFSIRFYEALHNGRIPVLLNTDTVLPLEQQIDYKNICVFSNNIDTLPDDVIEFSKTHDLLEVQRLCKETFNKYFHWDKLAETMFSEIPQ